MVPSAEGSCEQRYKPQCLVLSVKYIVMIVKNLRHPRGIKTLRPLLEVYLVASKDRLKGCALQVG